MTEQHTERRTDDEQADDSGGIRFVTRMPMDELLSTYAPGSQHERWTWHQEACWLWVHHQADMAWLIGDILRHGQREPVLLGDDGRVWDGHHRIVAHMAIHAEDVAVTWAVR